MSVDCAKEQVVLQIRPNIDCTGNLPGRVDSRIGATREHYWFDSVRCSTCERRECPFQLSLHRSPPRLNLGSGESGAVIADDELER